ncbi:hypothetical protein P4S72_20090 [Vibrio sp. PP-XX7]
MGQVEAGLSIAVQLMVPTTASVAVFRLVKKHAGVRKDGASPYTAIGKVRSQGLTGLRSEKTLG